MPFFGPFQLGGADFGQSAKDVQSLFPGSRLSAFAGPGGGTAGLGFEYGGPVLFRGQPLSSSSAISTAPPLAAGGPATGAPPESITAFLAGAGPHLSSLPGVGSPGAQGTPPSTGFGSGSIGGDGAGSPAAGGGAVGVGPGTAASGSNPGAIGIGFSEGDISTTATGMTPGQAGINAGLSAGLGALTGGLFGSVTPATATAGIIGSVVGGALGVPAGGPIGAGLAGFGLGVGHGMPGFGDVSTANADPTGLAEGVANSAAAAVGGIPSGMTPGEFGIVDTTDPGVVGLGVGEPGTGSGGAGVSAGDPGGSTGPGSSSSGTPGEADNSPSSGGSPSADAGVGDGGAGGAGDGGTVICTVLRDFGYMPDDLWEADRAFGAEIDPAILRGYQRWATPVARAMRRSAALRALLARPAMAWAKEMGYQMGVRSRGSLLGRVIMVLGIPICRRLGQRLVEPVLA